MVLDEAHLVPPFEALLRAIAQDCKKQLGPCLSDGAVLPRFRLMSLSATGPESKEAGGEAFRLSAKDYEHGVVPKRLKAPKQLTIEDGLTDKKQLAERLAERAWILGAEPRPARLLVYCNSRTAALAVKEEIDKQLKKHGHGERNSSELLVGERRVREREVLFEWLEAQGFIGEATGEPQAPTFLVATAAGEVGVDLDADHMVCDLIECVNRRGHKHARVEVIAAPSTDTKKDPEEWSTRLARLRAPLDALICHRCRSRIEISANQITPFLGIEFRRDARRVHQVAEHHRDTGAPPWLRLVAARPAPVGEVRSCGGAVLRKCTPRTRAGRVL